MPESHHVVVPSSVDEPPDTTPLPPATGPRLPLSLSLSLSLRVRRCSRSPPWSTGMAKHQANGFMGQAGWSCRRSRQPFDQRPRSRGTRTVYTNTPRICWSLLPWGLISWQEDPGRIGGDWRGNKLISPSIPSDPPGIPGHQISSERWRKTRGRGTLQVGLVFQWPHPEEIG
jgi:hypothetical protein